MYMGAHQANMTTISVHGSTPVMALLSIGWLSIINMSIRLSYLGEEARKRDLTTGPMGGTCDPSLGNEIPVTIF